MSLRELKFSNQIQEEQVKSVYHKNFNYIVTERFYFQQQWLHAAYNRFKDFGLNLIKNFNKEKASNGIIAAIKNAYE